MLRRVAYIAFVAGLLHFVLLVSTHVNPAKLASSFGLILDILGAWLLVMNLPASLRTVNRTHQGLAKPAHWTERLAVRLAGRPDRPPEASPSHSMTAHAALVWGLSFLVLGFVLQWAGVLLPH
jgi:hypothetical protein